MLDGVVPPLLVAATALLLTGVRQIYVKAGGRRRALADVAVMTAVVCFTAFLELEMGRTPAYEHGPARLWSGDIHSDQNSQQVFDPYTFTHIEHGAIFYGLTRTLLRSAPLASCAIVAITLESAWEVYENTDRVINRYRAATISLGYYGDSVVNSMADILACVVGLVLAWRLPKSVTVLWVVGVEAMLAFWIRDNLTLNIIMLIHPIAAIKTWQMGG
jgi:hypothetical protein